jgi:hypothetical protein
MKLLLLVTLLGSGLIEPARTAEEKEKPAVPEDVVAVAKNVAATRFAGFTYGPRQDKKQLDCVQFTGAVVEDLLKRSLTKEETDALYIRYTFEDLQAAVEAEDPRTKGIQRALTDLLKRGTTVPAGEVRAGDFVQYWIKGKQGKWAGHSALVTKVFTDAEGAAAIAIYGSNKSTNGIAEMDFGGKGLSLRGAGRKFYFVRFAPAPVTPEPSGAKP